MLCLSSLITQQFISLMTQASHCRLEGSSCTCPRFCKICLRLCKILLSAFHTSTLHTAPLGSVVHQQNAQLQNHINLIPTCVGNFGCVYLENRKKKSLVVILKEHPNLFSLHYTLSKNFDVSRKVIVCIQTCVSD